METEPAIRKITPLYQCLGYFRYPSGEVRYYISVRDEVRCYRARDMIGLGFLFELYAYPGYWAMHFPAQTRTRIDTREAGAWFVRECVKLGEYDPPEGLKPRGVGRPVKAV